jgi:hypothetical protein
MTSDLEMETWCEAWKFPEMPADKPSFLDMGRMVKRRKFKLRMLHVLELAWALFLLVFSYLLARHHPSTKSFLWALVVWILTVFASGYSLWNWRVLWNAETKPVCDYMRIYEKYCVAWLRYIRFGYWFLALNLAISVPWITWIFLRSAHTGHFGLIGYLIRIGLIAGLTTGYLLWFSRSQRNRLRELEELRQYRKGMDEDM